MNNKGLEFIVTRGKKPAEVLARKDRDISIIHANPTAYGLNRTAWRLEDIAKVYNRLYGTNLSKARFSAALKETNYSWKHARRVLTSNDPEYMEKTKRVLDTLRGMGPQDVFFFIDV